MVDEKQKEKLMAPCSCGCGMKYGEHLGKEELCFCGSGKMAKDCCMVTPEEHEKM
ncbi:MAG: SEC-C metal-binding domain-containing protein [Patescibacteria group bacterium]